MIPYYKQQVFAALALYFPDELATAAFKTDAELLALYAEMREQGYL